MSMPIVKPPTREEMSMQIRWLEAEVERLRAMSMQTLSACANCDRLEAENARLRAYAKHERSLGAEGPMIELVSAKQEIEWLQAIADAAAELIAEAERTQIGFVALSKLRVALERRKG